MANRIMTPARAEQLAAARANAVKRSRPNANKGAKIPRVIARPNLAEQVDAEARKRAAIAKRTAARAAKQTLKEEQDAEYKKKERYRLQGLATRKHDYDAMRDDFINSDKTLVQLADEWNCPYHMVRKRAAKEQWTLQRLNKVKTKVKEKRNLHLARMADEGIAFDTQTAQTAKLGMTLVAGRLAEIAAMFNANAPNHALVIENLKRGIPVPWQELRSVINYKELRELSQAGLAFQQMGRAAFGTDIMQLEIEAPDGVTVETVVNIGSELTRDDTSRLAAMIEALERAGLVKELDLLKGSDNQVIEGEVVEDEQQLELEGQSDAQG